ncbi:hypothetical protein BJ138DRAFT_300618 [Hygrophoropsis aurantiaca]|uniref:Uncharacterized protein n=1 Tax=Hygrophoropsis aurantiaca TaxID=72124 RepID=A0ACB8A786_9AGAM|nr:hypothetical protein BJ138DRAFT_300618 [Hygrophoropsis aurantiaca]
MQRQLAEVLVERESANEEYNRATSELQDEIATIRLKYKNLRTEKKECQEVIEELSNQLRAYTENEEKLKAEKKEYQEIIEELSNQLRAYTEKEEKLQAKTWEEYLPTTLLHDIDHGPIPAQPKLTASIPFSSTERLQINELALSTCTSDGIFECNNHQVQWSRDRIALGVIVRPAFQYNPEEPKRIWQKVLSFIEMGQTKDMMYWNSSGWHYMGTYECITPTYPISMDKLKSLKCLDESNNILNHIVPRTDSLSPIQKGILLELYDAGILMFEFFGLKCVGYNEKLRDALVNSPPAQKQPVGKDQPRIHTSTYPKRKRSREHNSFGPKNKKP